MGGTCLIVAVAGGYTQGGGHSLLSSKYRLSADNVLEWEVVLANGLHIVATPTQYKDLYYALCGGGGGIYAIVVSMIVKVFPESSTGISAVTIEYTPHRITQATFWDSIVAFYAYLPKWVNVREVVAYIVLNNLFFFTPFHFS